MSPLVAVRSWWDRWKITILFVGLVIVSLAVYRVNSVRAASEVRHACESVTQVKNAALSLARPISTNSVNDAATLDRIRVANAGRAEARHLLETKLACK